MQCLLLSSKNTHWISLNDSNTGLLPWQQAKKGGVGDRGARFDPKLSQVGEKDKKEVEIK